MGRRMVTGSHFLGGEMLRERHSAPLWFSEGSGLKMGLHSKKKEKKERKETLFFSNEEGEVWLPD